MKSMWRVTEEKKAERRSKKRKSQRKKIQVREKVGKSRNGVFFQWFVAPEGRKVGSLKRRVQSQLATWEIKNCTPLWREAHFQVKMYRTPQLRSPFRSCDVEKVHAIVARSTFRSQNVQNTPRSECSTLSSSKTEEVSQNSLVFKLAGRQTDRQTNREIDR